MAISLKTRCLADIQAQKVEFLWPRWIPHGKLCILAGDPGLGKSTLLLDLAARVSDHGIMPDGTEGVAGKVLILSAEDGAEDTIKPRLEAANADMSFVTLIESVEEDDGTDKKERPFELPRDFEILEKAVAGEGDDKSAELLIIDPLMAFLAGVDANKDQEIRRVLFRLSRIAEQYECTVIAMQHLNKSGGTKAIYRNNSSIGVIGHARAGFLVAQDPDDPGKRILAVSKCNLAAMPPSLRFELVPEGDVCRVAWCGTSPLKADDLVAPPLSEEQKQSLAEQQGQLGDCCELLQKLLGNGPMKVVDIKAHCKEAGISERTANRAAHKLQLKKYFQMEGNTRVHWWSLPAQAN